MAACPVTSRSAPSCRTSMSATERYFGVAAGAGQRALASIVAYGFQPVRLALNCCSCQMSRPLDFLQSSFWRKFGPA